MIPLGSQMLTNMNKKKKSKRPFYIMAVSNDAPTFCLFVSVCSFEFAIKRFTEVWEGILDNSVWIELRRGRDDDGIPECVLRRGYNFRASIKSCDNCLEV